MLGLSSINVLSVRESYGVPFKNSAKPYFELGYLFLVVVQREQGFSGRDSFCFVFELWMFLFCCGREAVDKVYDFSKR
jgi:hypothetical protein